MMDISIVILSVKIAVRLENKKLTFPNKNMKKENTLKEEIKNILLDKRLPSLEKTIEMILSAIQTRLPKEKEAEKGHKGSNSTDDCYQCREEKAYNLVLTQLKDQLT